MQRALSLLLWLCVASVVLAVGACADDVGTSVRVNLVYEDTWPIDSADLKAGELARTIALDHELLLLLPDDLDGQIVPISVAGMRGAENIANGSAVALIRKGETVDAAIVLDRVPCGAFCEPGARRCEGETSVAECVREPDGCLAWGESTECPLELHICSSGVCDRNCRDECAGSEGVCEDSTHMRACANSDSDPCLDLSQSIQCTGSEVCYSGRCAPACTYSSTLTNTTVPTLLAANAFGPVIAVDSGGTAHALYSVGGTYQLRYARRPRGGSWSAWADLTGAVGENPSMFIDRQGNVHVAYGGAALVYGVRSAATGTWQWSAPIETAAGIGRWSAVGLDSAGVPHIAYYDSINKTLRHAWRPAGAWMTEEADTDIGIGLDMVIAGDTLHVSSLSTSNNIWYSVKAPGQQWQSSRIDIGRTLVVRQQEVGTSIAIDRSGTLHFAYSDLYTGDDDMVYRYKTATGSNWTLLAVDDSILTNTGAYPDLVVDPFDNVHVAFRSTTGTPRLQYAMRAAGSFSWTLAVEPPQTSGFQPSIAVGADAEVRILSAQGPDIIETARTCNR